MPLSSRRSQPSGSTNSPGSPTASRSASVVMASLLSWRRVHSCADDPRRFRGVHPRRVQLAYISRRLVRGAVADLGQAAMLDRYLRGRGLTEGKPLTLVDVGIHGSIQDCLRRIYPRRAVSGRYLVLRRRIGDPNGALKRGFLADLDVAPHCPLEIGPSSPPLAGWELGGTLRRGDPLFLRPRSVHVLEDLWNGVGEAAERFQVSACGERVMVVRSRVDQVLALPPGPTITPMQRIEIKRAALRGIVDGVAQGRPDGARGIDVSEATRGLAAWLGGLERPAPDRRASSCARWYAGAGTGTPGTTWIQKTIWMQRRYGYRRRRRHAVIRQGGISCHHHHHRERRRG